MTWGRGNVLIVFSFLESILAVMVAEYRSLSIKEAWTLAFAESTPESTIWHLGLFFRHSHSAETLPATHHQIMGAVQEEGSCLPQNLILETHWECHAVVASVTSNS